jgi:D-alanyl-D-alanine carboxypeptidase
MRVAKVAYLSAVRRLLVLLLLPLSALANASLVPSPPTINADSYLVIDFDTGAV